MRRLGPLAFAGVVLASGGAAASHGPPWVDPETALALKGVASVRIVKGEQALFVGPWEGAARRGTAALEAHLPVFGTRRGSGCQGAWVEVGPLAWVCEQGIALSSQPAIDPRAHTLAEAADGLPYRYFFVGPDGSQSYKRLDEVDVGEPRMQLQPGFAVAILAERALDGAVYGRTEHGLWVPMRDLGPVHSFAFQGAALDGAEPGIGGIGVGWVVVDHARVYTKAGTASPSSASFARFELVHPLEEKAGLGGAFVRVAADAWLRAGDLGRPTLVDPPPEVNAAAAERWIDVDLASQTLVAYEGKRPVFATLVSTGKGKQGSVTGTPKGTHRIWIKLLTSDMDNLEDENAARYYRIEDVPWVQYFSKGVGLHGAFWHRSFGHVRSHGCVNLSPLDAQRLFWWTGPHLPAGWSAVLPTPHELGTVIRIR